MEKALNLSIQLSRWSFIKLLLLLFLFYSCTSKYSAKEEYYPNGIIKERYFLKESTLDSLYQSFDKDGKLVMMGYYYMGKRKGVWIEWDLNTSNKDSALLYYDSIGILQKKHFFSEEPELPGRLGYERISTYGKDTFERSITYYHNGQMAMEHNTINKVPNGIFMYFTEAGIVTDSCNYSNGFENGICKEWNPKTGNLLSEKMYDNGKLLWEKSYKDGKLVREKKY
ncbi:MAG: hypothetical protein MUF42_08920 [Cytophagaceae bacterium]|jgi:antitoxin component YwqK of YwqJK toxin-antitoxin module|nr:hypothetical protein [Cytophagaceae bacterium]